MKVFNNTVLVIYMLDLYSNIGMGTDIYLTYSYVTNSSTHIMLTYVINAWQVPYKTIVDCPEYKTAAIHMHNVHVYLYISYISIPIISYTIQQCDSMHND